jgi:hypothetical protein
VDSEVLDAEDDDSLALEDVVAEDKTTGVAAAAEVPVEVELTGTTGATATLVVWDSVNQLDHTSVVSKALTDTALMLLLAPPRIPPRIPLSPSALRKKPPVRISLSR